MNKKHIVINCWNYPENGKRGNPYLYDLFYSLSIRGYNITIVDIQFWGINNLKRFLNPSSNYKKIDGVRIFVIPILNIFPGFSKYFPRVYKSWVKYLMYKRIINYKKKFGKPDFIQHHFIINTPPFYTEYWSQALSIPYILFEHSFNVKVSDIERKKWPYYGVNNVMNFVKNAKYRIARTHFAKDFYEQIFISDFKAIPNFIPKNYLIQPLNVSSNDKFIFIIVGSLIERKAQELAILAFNQTFKNKNFELWIVGGGILFNQYNKTIKDLGIEKQVFILGEKSKNEVFELINKANVLLVSSLKETFGNTIIEAFYLGKPVISTKCGGPEELINERNGILCSHDINDISKAMIQIYNNYNFYEPEIIRSQAMTQFSEEVILNQIEELYNTIL